MIASHVDAQVQRTEVVPSAAGVETRAALEEPATWNPEELFSPSSLSSDSSSDEMDGKGSNKVVPDATKGSNSKSLLNKDSLAALNRCTSADLDSQDGKTSQKGVSEKELSERAKKVRHAHLNKFSRSMKSPGPRTL